MEEADLQLEPNEASDLTPVLGAEVLEAHGWDLAFATVLDEAPAEDAVALLVHARSEDSVLIRDRPEAAVSESLHVSFRLPRRSGVAPVTTETVKAFDGMTSDRGDLARRRAGALRRRP